MSAHTVLNVKRPTPAEHKRARTNHLPDVVTFPKRGDLVVHAHTERVYYIGQESDYRHTVRLGIITSVSRDGQIKRAWFPFAGSNVTPDAEHAEHAERMTGGALHYVAADRVDVPAILAEYAERRYPSAPHSDMIQPFSENADARALIIAHKR